MNFPKPLRRPGALILAASIAALLAPSTVRAADGSWNVNNAGSWSTAGSWLGGVIPGSTTATNSTDIATFGFTLTAGRTVTVDANRNIAGIIFSNTSAFGYTLSGGNLLLSNGGVIQSATNNGAHTDTIRSAIAIQGVGGSGTFTAGATSASSLLSIGAVTGVSTAGNTTTLTLNGDNTGANAVTGVIGNGSSGGRLAVVKSGNGVWVLSGANTFTGGVTLNSGTLRAGNAAALGTGTLTFAGGSLSSNSTTAYTLTNTMAFTNDATLGDTTNTGALTLSGNADLGGATRTLTVLSAATISGTVSNGGLTKNGAGTLALTGSNTYSGGTNLNAGVLSFTTGGLATTGAITFTGNSILKYGASTTTDLSSRLAINNGITGTIDTNGNNVTLATGFGASGSGSLTKIGAGTLTLSGSNTYTGATTSNVGTLALAFGTVASNILSDSSALTMGGGTLLLSGSGTQTVNGLTTTVNTGSRILLSGSNETLTLGALTSAGAGSSLNFNTAAGGADATGTDVGTSIVVLTGQTAGNAINSGFTVTDSTGFGLATVNGSNQVIRLTTATLLPASGATSGIDYLVNNNAGGSAAAGSSSLAVTTSGSAKSITVDTAASGTLSLNSGVVLGNNTWNFGGTGSNTYTITSGTLRSVASNDTISINNYNPGLVTIASPILANGANAVNFSGTGMTVLTGSNTYSGATTIFDGTLQIGGAGVLGTAGTYAGNITNNGALVYNSTANQTLSGTISGVGTVIKSGAANLTLSAANTFSGGLTVNAGTVASANPTGFGSGAITLGDTSGSNNARLDLSGGAITYANNITVQAGSSGTMNIFGTGNGTQTLSGNILLNRNVEVGHVFSSSQNMTLSGSIGGTGGLIVSASNVGQVRLTGSTTFSGGVTVNAGSLTLGNGGAISANYTGPTTINGGTLIVGVSGTFDKDVTNNGTLQIGDGSRQTLSGIISGTGNLIYSSVIARSNVITGTNNSYTGRTAITSSVTISKLADLGVNSSLGAPTTVANGTIDLNQTASSSARIIYVGTGDTSNRVINFLNTTSHGNEISSNGSGALVLTSNLTTSGSAKTLILSGTNTGNNTIQGIIPDGAGATSLTKSGAGTWVLTGANSYTGKTAIQAGSLSVATIGSVSGTGNLGAPTTAANGTIDIGSAITSGTLVYTGSGETTDRVINLLGTSGGAGIQADNASGTLVFSNNLTVTGSGAKTLTLSGSGAGQLQGAIPNYTGAGGPLNVSVTKTGAGTWTLSGNNSYSGATSQTGGTLNVDGNLTTSGITVNAASAIFNQGASSVISGASTTFTLTSGTATLSGTNTYGGLTTVSAGRLILAGNNTGAAGAITIGNGATLQVSSLANLSAGALQFNAGSVDGNKTTLALRYDGNTSIAKNAIGTASGSTFDQIMEFNVDRATAGGPTGGTITWGNSGTMAFNSDRGQLLVTGSNGYGLTLNQSLAWASGNNQTNRPNIVNNAPGLLTIQGNITTGNTNNISFAFAGTGDTLVTGTMGGSANWYVNKTGNGTLTLANAVTPKATSVRYLVQAGTLKLAVTSALDNGTTANWTAAKIAVASGATLAFNVGGTNEFTTGNVTTLLTNLAASTVTVTTSTGNGMNAGSVLGFDTTNASGGTFTIADTIANTTGAAGGARGLTKLGTNTLTLTGSNTYSGTTTVSAGTLQVGGSGTGTTGSGAVTVQSGGTILGTGTVRGSSFTADSGSTVHAGDGTAQGNYGTLTFTPVSGSGSFDFQIGSSIILGINPGSVGDLLNFNGLSAGTLTFNGNLAVTAPNGYTPVSEETFNLIDWANIGTLTFNDRFKASSYSGYLLGNGDDIQGFDLPDISSSGFGWDISAFITAGTISTVNLIPEPSRALLTLLGIIGIAGRRRRK
jgi:autotransporter-associated beta strand protein